MQEATRMIRLTPKGIAVLSAVDAGMLPRAENGWDTSQFDAFWEDFTDRLEEQGFSFLHKGDDPGNGSNESSDGLNQASDSRKEILAGFLGLLFAIGFALVSKL